MLGIGFAGFSGNLLVSTVGAVALLAHVGMASTRSLL
jgi:hypothetical protein